MAKIIELKTLPEYFSAVATDLKRFEVRRDDRNYAVGDILILREFDGLNYTGRKLSVKITYILRGGVYGVAEGYVVLSIVKFDEVRKCLKR